MKTIKDNWIWILTGVILLIGFFGYIHSCTGKKSDAKIEVSSDNSVKKLTIDSMKLDNLIKLSDQKDSLITQGDSRVKTQEIKTNDFKAQNKSLNIQVDALLKQYEETPTLSNCDSLVVGQSKVISTSDSTINYQHKTIDDLKGIEVSLKEKCNIQDSIIVIKTDQIKTINTDFSLYKTQTTKKEKSSKFWSGVKNIGLVVLTGLLIVKML